MPGDETTDPAPTTWQSAPPPTGQPPSQPGAYDAGPAPWAPPGAPGHPGPAGPVGPVGTVRSTGTCILLTVVTLGFYTWYWYYQTHEEMKRHSGEGIGGGVALLLAILVGIVMPFLTASEVGRLYARRGQAQPVSGATGWWALLLGWFFLVGAIVWFVKVNGALNAYWRSLGAR